MRSLWMLPSATCSLFISLYLVIYLSLIHMSGEAYRYVQTQVSSRTEVVCMGKKKKHCVAKLSGSIGVVVELAAGAVLHGALMASRYTLLGQPTLATSAISRSIPSPKGAALLRGRSADPP